MVRTTRLVLLSSLLLVLVALAGMAGPDVAKGKKVALVVGINKYQHSDLNNPKPLEFAEQEARDLAKELENFGYEVTLLLGEKATGESIQKALEALSKKGDGGSVVVVALAGHGLQPEKDKESYYYPWDARKHVVKVSGKDTAVWDMETLLPISKVLTYLQASPAGARMLLVDACRNDPKSGRGRGVGAGLKTSDLPDNTAVLLSCSEGEQSWEDKKWGHGAFFYHVLQGMRDKAVRKGKVTALSLAAYVEESVSTDQVNFNGNYPYPDKDPKGEHRKTTTPVKKFTANPWGLHDMGGNLWQWCEDRYAEYPKEDIEDTQSPQKGDKDASRVLRGGSWVSGAWGCRAAHRVRLAPAILYDDVGFRVALRQD